MPFPKLTWAGLLIATLGWGFILSYPLILPFVPDSTHGVGPSDSVRFIPILGGNALITGLAIAVLGGLERTLHLLGRIAGNEAQPPRMEKRPHQSLATAPAGPVPHSMGQMPVQTPLLMPQRSAGDVVTRGALNGR